MTAQELVKSIETAGPEDIINLPSCTIETNFGFYTLKDATWGDSVLQGFVVKGGDTSRLLHATSFTDKSGQIETFYYCSPRRCYVRGENVHFSCTFC